MSRGPDAALLLERALTASAARSGVPIRVAATEWRRWSSATFTGARHRLAVETDAGRQAEAWVDALPEAELPLRGHLVADVSVEAIRRVAGRIEAELEVLTVEAH